MALRVAVKAVGAVAVGHIVLTEVGVLKASLTRPEPPPNPVARVADCRRTASLTKVVSVMYSGGDLNATVGMRLADDVTFTDPAAACLGRSEVMEAFRALSAFCSPEHVEEPLPLASFESSPSATIQFHLHQRYFRGSFLLPQGLEMRSTLLVRCSGDDDRIYALEERWNGVPLLDSAPFRWVRRANGIMSYLGCSAAASLLAIRQ